MNTEQDAMMKIAGLAITLDAKSKETGQMFQGLPERWLDDPTWRCANGHVSKRYLKSEERGSVCLECYQPIWLTFPEDQEGCPKCGRKDLRTLTWRELGIEETSLGCWDCDWVTYPPGINADNWKMVMWEHKMKARLDAMTDDELITKLRAVGCKFIEP